MPRRPGSRWSQVNVDKVAVLAAAGRMQPSGQAVQAVEALGKTGWYALILKLLTTRDERARVARLAKIMPRLASGRGMPGVIGAAR